MSQKQTQDPKRARWVYGILIGVSVLTLVMYGYGLYVTSNLVAGRAMALPRTSIAGIPVGGLDEASATATLSQHVTGYGDGSFIFKHTDLSEPIKASPQDVGLSVSVIDSVRQAMTVGHNPNFLVQMYGQILAASGGSPLPAVVEFDPSIYDGFFDTTFLEIEDPAIDARLKYSDGELKNVEGSAGNEVARGTIAAEITEGARALKHASFDLQLVSTQPDVQIDDLDHTRQLAADILRTKLSVFRDDFYVSPSKDELGKMLEFHTVRPEDVLGRAACACGLPEHLRPNTGDNTADQNQRVPAMVVTPFDQERQGVKTTDPYYVLLPPENFLEQDLSSSVSVVGINRDELNHWLLENISAEVDEPGRDARLSFSNGEVTVTRPSIQGVGADVEQLARDVVFGIGKADGELALRFELQATKPSITEDRISELGINTLIGRGVSDFSGSAANRVHNIEVGFERYNGLVISPDEEFSVIEYLGPVDAAAGFLPELVIVGNKITPQYGGGLCQVSTTIFRTALDTGLDITERTNHAFSVSHYKWPFPDWGVEATIYDPQPDLKFINDTEGHILVQAYTTEDDLAIVEFYGTDPGRTTQIDGPYRLSGSYVDGGSTVFTYRILDSATGALLHEEEFVSVFQPLSKFKLED